MSLHLLTKNVAQESKEHVLDGYSLMNLRTSLSETN